MDILIHGITANFRSTADFELTPNFEPTLKIYKPTRPTRPKQLFDTHHPRTHVSTRPTESTDLYDLA